MQLAKGVTAWNCTAAAALEGEDESNGAGDGTATA